MPNRLLRIGVLASREKCGRMTDVGDVKSLKGGEGAMLEYVRRLRLPCSGMYLRRLGDSSRRGAKCRKNRATPLDASVISTMANVCSKSMDQCARRCAQIFTLGMIYVFNFVRNKDRTLACWVHSNLYPSQPSTLLAYCNSIGSNSTTRNRVN
jgi:hypothetical protein